MIIEYEKHIKGFKKCKDFLICIDSDGTVFNTQEIKIKDYVIPNIISIFQLEHISKYVCEIAEYVNLYSQWRGIERYTALLKVFELLNEREEIKGQGFTLNDIRPLRNWLAEEQIRCRASLMKAVNKSRDPFLAKVMEWDKAIDDCKAIDSRKNLIFKYVPKALEKASKLTDIVVVSSESCEVLEKEWKDGELAKYTRLIAGREMGEKKDIISGIKAGRYAGSHTIMAGDALGDLKAARSNNILFYPINPGREIFSWKRFLDEGIDKFIDRQYSKEYENHVITEFENILTPLPSWKSKEK